MHLTCFIKKSLIYSLLFFIAFHHIKNDGKYHDTLVDRIQTNIKKMGIKSTVVSEFIESPKFHANFYYVNIIIIVMAFISVFSNMTIGKLFCAFYFGLLVFIYYSPLLPESKINSDNLYGLSKDFLLYFAVFLGLIAFSFKESNKEKESEESNKANDNKMKKGKNKMKTA